MALEIPEDLVSLDQAKAHLRMRGVDEQDELIELQIKHATAIVVTYIAREADDDWTAEIEAWNDESVPPQVQAAILVQLAELFRYRGDEDAPTRAHGYPCPMVVSLLHALHDPAVS